jgi:hypothetical protein
MEMLRTGQGNTSDAPLVKGFLMMIIRSPLSTTAVQ